LRLPRAVLFDLDGTLSDSLPDIAWALNEAREAHGLARVADAVVKDWVGGGAEVLVVRSLGAADASDPRVAPMLAHLLRVYEAHTHNRSALYPGAAELLRSLKARGVLVACTTNKPDTAARSLLAGLGILQVFDAVVTPETAGVKKPDPRFMEAALAALGVAAADALVVGDGLQDVQSAKAAGIPCVAILGGYGDPAALRALGPDFCVGTIADVSELLRDIQRRA
jgi:phosphoglycolate phosphatase